MSHTLTTITKPVNTIDISSVLGVASRQVGYLCSNKHLRSNIWAKYKPVRFNKRNEIEEATKASVRYGMNVSAVNTDKGQIGKDVVWQYLPPRGVSYNEPCRMLDFNGYEHNATQPIDVVFPNKIYLNVPAGNLYKIYIDEDLGIAGNNLRVKDIFNEQLSWYPGMLVYNSTLNQSTFNTSEQPLSSFGGVTDYQIPLRSGWKTYDKVELWAILSKVKCTGNPDSAPALVEAYYMVPTSTNGYLSTQLDYYEPENQFVIVGVPVVNYTSYTNSSGEACWKVNSITCTARNESGITFTGRFSGMIEDEDGSVGSSYLPEVDKLMTPKVDITVAFNLTNVLFQKEYANIMRTSIYAENRATGKESLLYFGKFNFLTGEWEEE